jgi:hypothetical protein
METFYPRPVTQINTNANYAFLKSFLTINSDFRDLNINPTVWNFRTILAATGVPTMDKIIQVKLTSITLPNIYNLPSMKRVSHLLLKIDEFRGTHFGQNGSGATFCPLYFTPSDVNNLNIKWISAKLPTEGSVLTYNFRSPHGQVDTLTMSILGPDGNLFDLFKTSYKIDKITPDAIESTVHTIGEHDFQVGDPIEILNFVNGSSNDVNRLVNKHYEVSNVPNSQEFMIKLDLAGEDAFQSPPSSLRPLGQDAQVLSNDISGTRTVVKISPTNPAIIEVDRNFSIEGTFSPSISNFKNGSTEQVNNLVNAFHQDAFQSGSREFTLPNLDLSGEKEMSANTDLIFPLGRNAFIKSLKYNLSATFEITYLT